MDDTTLARFRAKYAERDMGYATPCWVWTAGANANGYGIFGNHDEPGRSKLAHRIAYELANGRTDSELDHLCRTRRCVRPDHLEPTSHRTNVLRGVGPSARQAKQTHCRRGHPLTGSNLVLWNGHRTCRICTRAKARSRVRRLKGLPSDTPSLANRTKTHCPKGHPYDRRNTGYRQQSNGRGGVGRYCRTCSREKTRQARPPKGPKTHCMHGHALTPENTRIQRRVRGLREYEERVCLTCQRGRHVSHYRSLVSGESRRIDTSPPALD